MEELRMNPYYRDSLEAAEETLKHSTASAETWIATWNVFIVETKAHTPDLGEHDILVLHHIKFNFDRAKSLAGSILETKHRLHYFLELQTDFEQFLVEAKINYSPSVTKLADNGFGQKCKLEIDKHQRHLDLESIFPSTDRDQADGEKRVGKPLLTVDQFIMLMFALGGTRIEGLERKDVAEGFSRLTGNSVTEFIKRFSWVLPTEKDGIKKFNIQPDVYSKDVGKVCEILSKMGLSNVADKLKENSNEL